MKSIAVPTIVAGAIIMLASPLCLLAKCSVVNMMLDTSPNSATIIAYRVMPHLRTCDFFAYAFFFVGLAVLLFGIFSTTSMCQKFLGDKNGPNPVLETEGR